MVCVCVRACQHVHLFGDQMTTPVSQLPPYMCALKIEFEAPGLVINDFSL